MERGYTFAKSLTAMIEWKINNVNSYLNKKDNKTDNLKSSVFSIGSKIGDQWQLRFYFNHECTNNRLNGNTWIVVHNMKSDAITAKIAFFILNSKQEKILIEEKEHNFPPKERAGGLLFKDKRFLDHMSEFVSNDMLTLYTRITVSNENPTTIPIENLCTLSESQLANDLSKLYESRDNSDVTITLGNTKFQAHKLLLSVRSPVLAAMFAHDMVEKKSNEVFIPDIDPEIFEKVLEYIYTDKVTDLNIVADRVLEAADKYQIQSLKDICEDALIKSLNRENIIKAVILADRHNAKNLKDYAIKCITADATDVMKLSEFDQLEENSPFLALELLKKIVLEKFDNKTTITLTN